MTKTAAIIGAGPAGLSAAELLAEAGIETHAYERLASPARKLLMAGRGGLNLTHSEKFEHFLLRYGETAAHLKPFLDEFGPEQLRGWCAGLGEETFVGSSGRVFPKSFKASPLLRAWLRKLTASGVQLHLRHEFKGFEEREALFSTPLGPKRVRADVFVLALGGASWPRLGSDGRWVKALAEIGIGATALRPANCGFEIHWSAPVLQRCEGHALKNIRLWCGDQSSRGECVITRRGLEGGAVYALSALVRDRLRDGLKPEVKIDLRPDVAAKDLAARFSKSRGKESLSNFLRKTANLSPEIVTLLREPGELPRDPDQLAHRVKGLPLAVHDIASLDRAISTAGGVTWQSLDDRLMARSFPGLFVAGEMLDWEAPTGGYLLTACFATGRAAGREAVRWLKGSASS